MLFSPQNSIIGESQINEMLGTCVVGLTVSGNWSNPQYTGTAVDYTGLSFIAIYSNGTISSVTPTSVSPSVWGSTVGTQTATFTYTENRFSVTISKDASVEAAIPVSLSITGDWSNPQYIEQAVDYTGLVFTVTYSDGNSSVVTPTSLSPSTWSSTVGTQSCTFSYTEDEVTVSASKSATVYRKLISLSVGGSWSNTQYTSSAVDTTGLTFTATYNNGSTASVSPSVSPSTWSSTAGTQTATFTYSENGVSVTATKSASVVASWSAVAITLTNPNSSLVFRSISGNLYTNSACTTKASTNTKYTGTTFYYKSTESKPTGSYLYNCGDGTWSSSEPSQDTITTYYNEGSLTACLGTSGSCWSSTKYRSSLFYNIRLSDGHWYAAPYDYTYHRVREASF